MCVIKVGAPTEVELKEKKHRIEDAVSATRAAIEEGIVAGGGAALVHAALGALDGLGRSGDERIGVGVVRKALDEPLRWIAENAGEQGYVVVAKVREAGPGRGLDAATGQLRDLIGAGIIDPVKVTRSALENAASIAGMLLTTEALVVGQARGVGGRQRSRAWPQPRARRAHPLALIPTAASIEPASQARPGSAGSLPFALSSWSGGVRPDVVMCRSAPRLLVEDDLALGLGQSAPDPEGLTHSERMLATLGQDRAGGAQGLGSVLAGLLGAAPLTLRVEEHL